MEQIPNITFCITSKNNLRYLKHAVTFIRQNCYNKENKILVFIDRDEDGTEEWCKENNVPYIKNPNQELFGIGNAYNLLVEKAETDFVIIYHADMIAGKNLDLNLYKHWKKGLVVSATRIEPPLHPEDPSKIVKDFGLWPELDVQDGFKLDDFNKFVEENLDNESVTKGVFAPWLIHKADFQEVGGHDPIMKSHSEDRDLFNRFLLNGFDFVQPWNALVYHLTCRGGQFEHASKSEHLTEKSKEWNLLAFSQTRAFIRKWGSAPLYNEYQYPIIVPKYDVGVKIKNAIPQIVGYLEPHFSTIYCDVDAATEYLKNERETFGHDLVQKFRPFDSKPENEIMIEFDFADIEKSPERLQFLNFIPMVIKDNGAIGKFQYDCYLVTINKMTEYQKRLVKI